MIRSLTSGPYESAVSMRFTPSSIARRSTAWARGRSGGSPQMPFPVSRIAPKPIRRTTRSPPRVIEPAAAAGRLLGIAVSFRPESAAGGALGLAEQCLGLMDALPAEKSQLFLLPPGRPDEEILQLQPDPLGQRQDIGRSRLPAAAQWRQEQPVVSLPPGTILPVLLHLEHAQDPGLHHRAGDGRPAADQHRVERVAVLGEGGRDEAPVIRVMQTERQWAAQRDVPEV